MWSRGGDWWRLWAESRVGCAAAPADASGGPPSGNTPRAGSGVEEATGEPGTPARAEKPTAEAPPAAPADAPLGPPSGGTPSAGSGAEVATGAPGTPARAEKPAADAPATPPADALLGPRSGDPPSADSGAEVAADVSDGAPPARAPSNRAAGAERRSSGGRARWSAACAGAIQQCGGR